MRRATIVLLLGLAALFAAAAGGCDSNARPGGDYDIGPQGDGNGN